MDSSNPAHHPLAQDYQAHYLEQRTVGDQNSLSWDLARHVYTRVSCGRMLVLTDDPVPTLAAFKKQWLKLCRRVQRERSSTFNPTYLMQYTRQIARMQALQTTTESPQAAPDADMYFLTPEGVIEHIGLLPHFNTVYATCALPDDFIETFAADLPEKSLIVTYG